MSLPVLSSVSVKCGSHPAPSTISSPPITGMSRVTSFDLLHELGTFQVPSRSPSPVLYPTRDCVALCQSPSAQGSQLCGVAAGIGEVRGRGGQQQSRGHQGVQRHDVSSRTGRGRTSGSAGGILHGVLSITISNGVNISCQKRRSAS